jgi:ligand-binding sensor domain-containing protein
MRFVYLLFSLFFAGSSLAQNSLHAVNLYTTKDGLSNNLILALRQDSRGFLWLATKEGLNRFDGFQFKKYFFEKNNPSSLTHNNVFDIMEYQYGQLLIGTGNGLSVLNTLTGKFENQKIKVADLQQGSGNIISSLYKDQQGNIWVNHNGELDLLDSNLNYRYRVTDLDWAAKLKGALIGVEDWQTDRQGRLWFLSDTTGINIIDLAAKKVYNSKNNPGQLAYLHYSYLRSFLLDEANKAIWYSPWGEALIRYDMVTRKEQQVNFGINGTGEIKTINSIVKTNEGAILCGMAGKCFVLDASTLAYHEVPLPSPENPIKEITPVAILKTGERYWIGAYQGLLLLDDKETYKELPVAGPNNSDTRECTNICIASSGKIYCAYANNILVAVNKDRDGYAAYPLPGKKDNMFVSVAEDASHRIWAGSTSGMFLFDEKTKRFSQPDFLPAALRQYMVNIIYNDSDGSLWIGTRNPLTLYHYYPAENRFEKINDGAVNQFAAFGKNSRISNITNDQHGHLWMTSKLGGGIICYNKKDYKWTLYPPKGRNYDFLQNKGFACMYADADGYLWLSNLFRDGLIRYDYKTDSISTFTRSDGLLSDFIQNIYGDSDRLWLTTEYGITAFNRKTLRSESNILLNGIEGEQAVAIDWVSNEQVIGLPGHLFFIPFMSGRDPELLPIPVLDKITVNNQQQFPGAQELQLSYEQNNIAIDFTAVNFLNNKTGFAYKLSGVDKDWKYAGENRSAQYSILAPGSYSFFVQTGNDQGAWSRPYELFSFTILPPWWKTWWFYAICFLTVGLLVYVWIKSRERNIRNRAAERARAEAVIQQTQMQLTAQQHKMAQAEMLALRAQMNPHFLFNSLNSINNYILKNDADNAAGYLTKFSRLMRLILDNSRSNWILLQNELRALELYVELEAFRFDNSFSYEINIDEGLSNEPLCVPPMIIQPYVENAIWHGLMHSKQSKAHLQVDIYKEKENLCIVVRDNGIGRQAAGRLKSRAADSQKSHGMKITAERLEIMNKVYDINARVTITDLCKDDATGTEVLIQFKYQFHNESLNV